MSDIRPKRATVYFDPLLYRTLRQKAAETDCSVSDLVNDAVREALSDNEPDLPFEDVVKDLKRRGRI